MPVARTLARKPPPTIRVPLKAPVRPRGPSGPHDPRRPFATAPAGEPIFLSSEIVVQQNGLANLDSQALMSPRRAPMYIDELSFIGFPSPTTDAVPSIALSGGILGASLKIGAIQITNNYVPLWCFDRRYDSALEIEAERVLNVNGYDASYRWRFDEPLYVPPGACLNGAVQQFGFGGAPATVVVGIYGREMPLGHMPARLVVPYATAYVSPQFAANSAGTDESAPVVLSNATGELVHVSRIVGRLMCGFTSLSVTTFDDVNLADQGAALVQLQIWHSSGHPIVRTYAPFFTVFPPGTAAITESHDLDPRAFYRVRVNKVATATAYNTTTELGAVSQVQVAVVGSREV